VGLKDGLRRTIAYFRTLSGSAAPVAQLREPVAAE
jgi:hypothetical protein